MDVRESLRSGSGELKKRPKPGCQNSFVATRRLREREGGAGGVRRALRRSLKTRYFSMALRRCDTRAPSVNPAGVFIARAKITVL
jgi:hypothetical protein